MKMVHRVAVITTDGPSSALALPIAEQRLREVADKRSGMKTEEEKACAQWALSVTLVGMDCPLDEDRLHDIIAGTRTTSSEDYVMAEWVLEVWKILSDMR